jgi:eukaryotic-like serine/threonine-protein kinase
MQRLRLVPSLGPYLVEAIIGSGGMGVVYRGRHGLTGALAALKTVQVDSAEHLAAFRREVQVLAGLHHPGIVRILDHGISDGTPWYAMDLVDGRPLSGMLRAPLPSETEVVTGSLACSTASLTEYLERPTSVTRLRVMPLLGPHEPAPIPELLRVVRKVCSALAFLHSHGLVHRDLKPENILIQVAGDPVLVDFGIVGQFGDSKGREVLTLTRSAGTLAYMAPEQASGLFIDARADLFSLGCILYECIVGQLPFGPSGLYDVSLPAPAPPSKSAIGVTPELDELVMGLLAKDPRERVGYAEDVAAALDRIINDDAAPSAQTSEPAYLYRPDFAGRGTTLDRLTSRLGERGREGGSITLISGESGLGKTRLVLELGARAVAAGMTVVTGECKPVGAVALDGGARSAPLHPFRNFLLSVVDACRAGGKPVAERLLAGRGAVLAPFEPALSSLLVEGEAAPPLLAPELARARVFSALSGLLEAFTLERPLSLLLLIDDLQWADSLSLEFLSTLAKSPKRVACQIVATYRSEEEGAELAGLVALPSVTSERLGRFDRGAVSDMVSGMLALPEPPEDWVAFLEEESRGNPFFIAEYLRAAISERLLTRTRAGRWTLGSVGEGGNLRDRLGLPATIGDLVSRRLAGLDHEALLTVQAAAVLGREFDAALVAETAGIEPSIVSSAYARLRQRQILEEEASGECSFVHDKLREIAYGLIDGAARGALHGRAAAALTARQERGEARVELGTLGYHHAQAGAAARAADYFERAAARARQHHANRDAVRFYRLALVELEKAGGPQAPIDSRVGSRVREALADVLVLNNELDDARLALDRALLDTAPEERIARARRRRLLARTWERQHQHERALELYAQAEQDLGEEPQSPAEVEEFWFERVQIQIQSTFDLYFLSRVGELAALIERVRPGIETRGTPLQRAQFFQALAHMNVRRDRYRIVPETLQYVRASLSAAEQQADPRELALAHFTLAFPLMFAGHDAEAEPYYQKAVAGAERVGDKALETRSLAYYSILHRRLGRVPETRATSLTVLEIAQKQDFNDYLGVANANLCWVALREGSSVEPLATDALAAWSRLPPGYPYPLQWLARIPLAAYLTSNGRLEDALGQWEPLLDPAQSLLPDRLNEAIRGALAQRDGDGGADASSVLALSQLARDLGFL